MTTEQTKELAEAQEVAQNNYAQLAALRAENAALRAALTDAEFLMRQAGKYAGPMQDSFNRSAQDARAALGEY